MEKLTAEKILEIINENLSLEEFGHEDYDPEEFGFGKLKVVDRGGGMDKGSEWYRVFHFVDHDVYIRIDGYYQSHYGTDFDSAPYEVFPKEVTIIEYVSNK